MNMTRKLKDKKLIIFDLDGTLTESKSYMDAEMSRLLCEILAKKTVAVIGGGKYDLFKKQFLSKLKCPKKLLTKLYLFPTTATIFYHHNGRAWKKVYEYKLPPQTRKKIIKAFEKVFRGLNYNHPKKTYGKIIEDRGSQITFSALGQNVVEKLGAKGIRMKKDWKRKNQGLKMKIARQLQKLLPNLEVRAAGYTSIDVTRKGIDKAYGIRQIQRYLKIPIKNMIFVGDALEPGGNDYAARKTGIKCIEVSGPAEAKKIIKAAIASLY